jgi:DNA-binding CsgD family transcriptional regulator
MRPRSAGPLGRGPKPLGLESHAVPSSATTYAEPVRRFVSPVLVARRGELATLRRAAEHAAAGDAAAVVVGGEAGVGKTRLLAEASAELEAAGFEVLTGACVELGGDALPLAPLVDALRTLHRTRSRDEIDSILGPSRPVLARLLPELDPEAPAGGAFEAARLYELVVGMLGRLAVDRPVAFFVEDAHWADQSTLDFIAFLVRALRGVRALLVVTYRSDELQRGHPLRRLLAELERDRSVERVELPRFSRVEVAEQLEAIRGEVPDPSVVDLVFERSEGNAFLVEETLEIVATGGSEMPPSLRDVLLARVDRLGEDARRLLRAVAASGGSAGEPLLAAVLGVRETDELLAALREAVEHHLLIVDPDGTYRFRHALARDAVYEDMLPGERSRMHAAFGAALEADPAVGGGSTAASIAWHWYAALDLPRALPACIQAAREGMEGYAVAEAQRQCERALEIWDRVPDAEERTGLDRLGLLELALRASIRAGHEMRALAHAADALAEVDAQAEPRRAAMILADRAEALQRVGRDNVPDLAAAVDLLGERPSRELAAVLALLGRARTLQGAEAEGQAAAERALSVARAVGAVEEEATALLVLGSTRTYLGEVKEGIDALRRSLSLALAHDDHETAWAAYANLSDALELAGEHAEAVDVAAAGVELSHRLGLVRRAGIFIAGNLAESLGRMGRIDEALQTAADAVALGSDSASAASTQIIRAEFLVQRGRNEEARQHAATVRVALGDDPPHQFQAHISFVEAELARADGDLVAARAAVARGLGGERAMLARYTWPLAWLGLQIEADDADGFRARREPVPAEILDRAERLWATAAGYELVNPASRGYQALAGAERERLLGANLPAAWERAAAAWREPGDPYPLAYALLRLAEALADGGDAAGARAPLAEALSLARTLAAEPLCAAAEALARRARIDVAAAESSAAVDEDPFGLTDREREVLQLIASGSSNAQIGEALFISPKTASVHVSNILGKLGVTRRGEAAAVAHRLGLT